MQKINHRAAQRSVNQVVSNRASHLQTQSHAQPALLSRQLAVVKYDDADHHGGKHGKERATALEHPEGRAGIGGVRQIENITQRRMHNDGFAHDHAGAHQPLGVLVESNRQRSHHKKK